MKDRIICPLVDKHIDIVDCMENRDTKIEFIPSEFKKKQNWEAICEQCKYHKE